MKDNQEASLNATFERPLADPLESHRQRESTIEIARPADALPLAALRVAMEGLSDAAFVIRCDPVQVLFANARGKTMYRSNVVETLANLAEIQKHASSRDAVVTRFRSGPDDLAFVVVRQPEFDIDRMREHAIAVWGLTPRQAEVATLLMKGIGNKEIADALKCSMKTVEKHVSAVLAKAHVGSRGALLAIVIGLCS